MDPLTVLSAALAAITAAITLATKIWDATPAAIQQAEASNWGKIITNITGFFVWVQTKFDTLLEKK